MKCDELKRHGIRGVMYNGEEICGGFAYYDADEVDEAIAELKARIHELESMPHTDNSAVIELLQNENKDLKDKLRHYPMMAAIIESDMKELAELREAHPGYYSRANRLKRKEKRENGNIAA